MSYTVSITCYGLTIPKDKLADAWAALCVWADEEYPSLETALRDYSFTGHYNPDGDFVIWEHQDDRWEDEIEEVFQVLARFVKDDAVYVEGEDDYRWGYRFKDGTITQLKGEVVYHDVGQLDTLP